MIRNFGLLTAIVCLATSGCFSKTPLIKIKLFCREQLQTIMISSPSGITLSGQNQRVRLNDVRKYTPLKLTWTPSGVEGYAGNKVIPIADDTRIFPNDRDTPLIIGHPRQPPRPYKGELYVFHDKNALTAVNVIKIDDYVSAVVSQEMPVTWPLQALKAQAVVSRTYALKNRSKHARETHYQFCDLAHCQVYKGCMEVTPKVNKAVAETRDQVVYYHNHLMNTLFHSTCGGMTVSNREIWDGTADTGLVSVADQEQGINWCADSPYSHWGIMITRAKLTTVLRNSQASITDNIYDLVITDSTSHGRVKKITYKFKGNSYALSGEKFYSQWGQSLGWHQLKSTWFDVKEKNSMFYFNGHGLGHGIGFCQWGAKGRAEKGWDYGQIILAYFPKGRIKTYHHKKDGF